MQPDILVRTLTDEKELLVQALLKELEEAEAALENLKKEDLALLSKMEEAENREAEIEAELESLS